MHFGLLVPNGDGHFNPLLALTVELQQRGHRVTFFAVPDSLAAGKAAGIEVVECAAKQMPLGTIARMHKLSTEGVPFWKMFDYMKQVETLFEAYLLAVDDWLTRNPKTLDCLLVDCLVPHLYLLGEKHQIPYILLGITIPGLLSSPSDVPPSILDWSYSDSLFAKIRNHLGNTLAKLITDPFFNKVRDKYAKAWSLPCSKSIGVSRKALAWITQIPEAFDFPRSDKNRYIYTGPWVNPSKRVKLDFPWEQLNGKPLIYASLGTVFNDQKEAYTIIADVCSKLGCQLVLSVGPHILDTVLEDFQHKYPQFIFVRKAPQVELLQCTTLAINHAGTNSVLEALQVGIPMVAIPIGSDQPGVAARIRFHKVGVSIPMSKLSCERLLDALKEVLKNKVYTHNAHIFAKLIESKPGLIQAAEAIEQVLTNDRA
jgi:UDP:flavonoid glycosyltransferase YjiC (YdhE family)